MIGIFKIIFDLYQIITNIKERLGLAAESRLQSPVAFKFKIDNQ